MRALVLSACLAGCAAPVGPEGTPTSNAPPETGGGLPTVNCAVGVCPDCVGCSVRDFGCFGWGGNSTFNSPGKCKAAPTSGAVQAKIAGVDFVATAAVAVVDHGMISLSAQAGAPLVVLYAPAAVGSYDCATWRAGVAYFAGRELGDPVDFRSAPVLDGAPTCTLTVTRVGAVGELVEGAFTATLVDWRPAQGPRATLAIEGTFLVTRGPFAL